MNIYGLIGYPLGHSFSKQYFNDKFEREGLEDCFFELFPIDNIGLFPELLNAHPGLRGMAVTIPYKQVVMPFLDFIDEKARAIGAVNCIRILPGRLLGYNTDIIGFERSLKPLLQPGHKKALVLGSGGASLAVQAALKEMGIGFLLVSRKAADGMISYREITEEIIQTHTLIINCTPLGMSPNEAGLPDLPYEFIGAQHLLYDLVYQPAETRFLSEGKKRGAVIKNGYEMLVLQAEENWTIWNIPEANLPAQ
ncbi:MAG: aroE [Ferruginibacter sp.]|nr:aroE [Ferruginibacter sp.]